MTTAILFHAHPSVRERYAAALGVPDLQIVTSTKSQFSAGYDGTTGFAREPMPTVLDARAPGWRERGPLVLLGFSAGCWAPRHWLRDAENRRLVSACVLIDGLHGESEGALGGVLEFARLCLAQPSKHRLVATNSDIDPVQYASTSDAARWLLDGLSIPLAERRKFDDWEHPSGAVAVLDFGGRDAAAHVAQLQRWGVEACARLVGPWLRRLVEDEDTQPGVLHPTPAPAPAGMPLRERALAACLSEAQRWGAQAPDRARISEYLAGAVRGGSRIGSWLASQSPAPNHCAGAQGWAERQGAERGEIVPPWRAAAKELMGDARSGARGRWHPIAEVAAGWWPPPGALAIYHRGPPGAWTGHVDRVVRCIDQRLYECVGANEGGRRWVVEVSHFANPNLLGFVVDGERSFETAPAATVTPALPPDAGEPPLTDEDRRQIRGLVALTLADAGREAVDAGRGEDT